MTVALQTAFEQAQQAYPQGFHLDGEFARRSFDLADAYSESGNPAHRDQLVLREVRLTREFEHDDPDQDEWRVAAPRNHWGFMLAKAGTR